MIHMLIFATFTIAIEALHYVNSFGQFTSFTSIAIILAGSIWLFAMATERRGRFPVHRFIFPRNIRALPRNKLYAKSITLDKTNFHVVKIVREEKLIQCMWPVDQLKAIRAEEFFIGRIGPNLVNEIISEDGQFLIGMLPRTPDDKNSSERLQNCVVWFIWLDVLRFVEIELTRDRSTSLYTIEKSITDRRFASLAKLITFYSVDGHSFAFCDDTSDTMLEVTLRSYQTWRPTLPHSFIHVRRLTFLQKIDFKPVFFANLKDSKSGKSIKTIVKASDRREPDQIEKAIVHEFEILRRFSHENVLKLLGIVVDTTKTLLVVERGETDLSYFVYYYKIPLCFKLNLILDIATGLEHMVSRGYLHNDISVQNVVLFRNRGSSINIVAKIIDFDRALPIDKNNPYTNLHQLDDVPVLYMSPEALLGRGSEKSDIWQFGVLIWEIFTGGQTPYAEITNKSFIGDKIIAGLIRLAPPPAPSVVRLLVESCWARSASRRPSFSVLIRRLQYVLHEANIFCNIMDTSIGQPVVIYTYSVENWMFRLAIERAAKNLTAKMCKSDQAFSLCDMLARLTSQPWNCIIGENFFNAEIPLNRDVLTFAISGLKFYLFSALKTDKQSESVNRKLRYIKVH